MDQISGFFFFLIQGSTQQRRRIAQVSHLVLLNKLKHSLKEIFSFILTDLRQPMRNITIIEIPS